MIPMILRIRLVFLARVGVVKWSQWMIVLLSLFHDFLSMLLFPSASWMLWNWFYAFSTLVIGIYFLQISKKKARSSSSVLNYKQPSKLSVHTTNHISSFHKLSMKNSKGSRTFWLILRKGYFNHCELCKLHAEKWRTVTLSSTWLSFWPEFFFFDSHLQIKLNCTVFTFLPYQTTTISKVIQLTWNHFLGNIDSHTSVNLICFAF